MKLVNSNKWDTYHRPWPLPKFPWVHHQSWNDLLFIHYPIDISILRPLVPEQLTIDTYDQTAWISIVPFKMNNVGMRAIPFTISFSELNVRTYVTIDNKPGVYFFSLDASNHPVVTLCNTFLNLPYIYSSMPMHYNNDNIHFSSHRKKDDHIIFDCSYSPVSEPYFAAKDSLDYWLTERYCFYVTNRSGKLNRCDILHEPWPIQQAEAFININKLPIMKSIDSAIHSSPLLHFSKGVDVRVWPLSRV